MHKLYKQLRRTISCLLVLMLVLGIMPTMAMEPHSADNSEYTVELDLEVEVAQGEQIDDEEEMEDVPPENEEGFMPEENVPEEEEELEKDPLPGGLVAGEQPYGDYSYTPLDPFELLTDEVLIHVIPEYHDMEVPDASDLIIQRLIMIALGEEPVEPDVLIQEEPVVTDRYIVKYAVEEPEEVREQLAAVSLSLELMEMPVLDAVQDVEDEDKDVQDAEDEDQVHDLDEHEDDEANDEPKESGKPEPTTLFELLILEEPVAPSALREQLEELELATDEIVYIQPDYQLTISELELELVEPEAEDDDPESDEPEPEKDDPAGTEEPDEDFVNEDDAEERDGSNDSNEGSSDPDKDTSVREDDSETDADIEDSEEEDSVKPEQDDTIETAPEKGPVIVALIDTGVDLDHPDLEEHIYVGVEERSTTAEWNFVTGSRRFYDSNRPADSAHGTHIAGIIAQTAREQDAEVVILSLKVFENGVAYTSDVIAAVEYAGAMGADVINMSFGSSQDNPALAEALQNTDALLIAAVGNSRRDLEDQPVYPAAYAFENLIAVTSVNPDGGLSYFANYGPDLVDLAAVGRDVESCLPEDDRGPMTGTSMAAGQVSAAAAVTLANSGELLTVPELRERLIETGDMLSNLQEAVKDGRRLHLENALSDARQDEILDLDPADDFNIKGLQEDEGDLFELFSQGMLADVSASYYAAVRNDLTADYFSLALLSDGTVWAWGDNTYGQCGNGDMSTILNPLSAEVHQVVGLRNVVDISAGTSLAVAVKRDGTVWSWGRRTESQLGYMPSSLYGSPLPGQVVGLNGIIAADTGEYFSLALRLDGTVWAWGSNRNQQLGLPLSTTSYGTPVQIDGLSKVAAISAGNAHGLALRENGTVWMWGSMTDGKAMQISGLSGVTAIHADTSGGYALLSDGTLRRIDADMSVSTVEGVSDVSAMASGGSMPYVITENGTLWLLGDTPQEIGLDNVTTVSGGGKHTLAITTDNRLWGWGDNSRGQVLLGIPSDDAILIPIVLTNIENMHTYTLHYYYDEESTPFATVEARGLYGQSIPRRTELIYYPGYGSFRDGYEKEGIVREGSATVISESVEDNVVYIAFPPIMIEYTVEYFYESDELLEQSGEEPFDTSVRKGLLHSVIPTEEDLHYEGELLDGYLRDGVVRDPSARSISEDPEQNTVQVELPLGSFGYTVKYYYAGTTLPFHVEEKEARFATPLPQDEDLYFSGDLFPGFGRLGAVMLGSTEAVGSTPEENILEIVLQPDSQVSGAEQISAGGNHNLVLASDGTVWVWGTNDMGQCGTGSTSIAAKPTQLEELENVVMVAAGSEHSLALKEDGTVWAWGNGANGRLGNGATSTQTRPVQTRNLNNIIAIAAGANHSLALASDGTVWAWGQGNHGQLGNGGTTASTIPVRVTGLENVEQIDAGQNFSMALLADGTVHTWGRNNVFQLGNGSNVSSSVPVTVSNLNGVQSIAAGYDHAMAVLEDGSLWGWGRNNYYQLGVGVNSNAATPMRVTALQNVIKASGGERNGMALLEDGSVYTWGNAAMGQVGNGDTAALKAPARMELENVEYISFGFNHALTMDAQGNLWGWGDNTDKQLESVTGQESHLVPVLIWELAEEGTVPQIWVVAVIEDHAGDEDTESVYAVMDGQQFAYTAERVTGSSIHDVKVVPANADMQYSKYSQTVELPEVYADTKITIAFDSGYVYRIAYYYEGEETPFDVVEAIGTLGQSIPSASERRYVGDMDINYSVSGVVRDDSALTVTEDIDGNVARVTLRRLYNYQILYFKGEVTQVADPEHFLFRVNGTGFVGDAITVNDSIFAPGKGYKRRGEVSGIDVISENEEENVVYVLFLESTSLGEAMLTLDVLAGNTYLVAMQGILVDTFDGYTITVRYDPAILELVDVACHRESNATLAGEVPGTELTIESHENGELILTSEKEIPDAKEWTGLITLLEFRAIASGETVIALE